MMRVSLILWLVFSVYWSIAARQRAADQSSESVVSRRFHLLLVNMALLLLVLPVLGLTRRFLPEDRVLAVAGVSIQAAFILLAVWARTLSVSRRSHSQSSAGPGASVLER